MPVSAEPPTVEEVDISTSPQETGTYPPETEAEPQDTEEVVSVDLPRENSRIEWECETWLDGQ